MFEKIPDGTTLFVDSNIFLYHFMDVENLGPPCSRLLLRIENQEINGITTVLNITEINHKLMLAELASKLNKPFKSIVNYIKKHPDELKLLKKTYEAIKSIVDFNIHIHPVTFDDILNGDQYQKEFGLLTIDAIVLAVIRKLNIKNIATNDRDFKRVDSLTIWSP